MEEKDDEEQMKMVSILQIMFVFCCVVVKGLGMDKRVDKRRCSQLLLLCPRAKTLVKKLVWICN